MKLEQMEQEIIKLNRKIEVLEKKLLFVEQKLSINNDSENEKVLYKQSNRDKTKYVFNGKILPKNRLVFTITYDYISKNLNLNLVELQKVFDKSLQGSLQVIEDYNKVLNIKDYKKRYFCNDNELIKLNDGTVIAICTQWGIFNIKKFIIVAKELGYDIKEI